MAVSKCQVVMRDMTIVGMTDMKLTLIGIVRGPYSCGTMLA
jgi:hypothetical protein